MQSTLTQKITSLIPMKVSPNNVLHVFKEKIQQIKKHGNMSPNVYLFPNIHI